MITLLGILFSICLMGGLFSLVIFLTQYGLMGLHVFLNQYKRCGEYYPNLAIIIPCWNEGIVIGKTIERVLCSQYPKQALKIYVIDDASTDDSPQIILEKVNTFPNSVIYLRKNEGGKGKAHTLNFGLDNILKDDWAQAIMIIDADVMIQPNSLGKMTRHLLDPNVGAVTAYIRASSTPRTMISRSIAFEYIIAQALGRRIQNVLGALACLAGGAQLHTRENIERLGGRINTSTLAEDTYTTLETELGGKKTLFEGNAVVDCEEPDEIVALWKQRLRWGRGNLQITQKFKSIWFKSSNQHRLGGWLFSLIWFSILLTPIFMILYSIGLVGIFFISKHYSFYLLNLFCFISLMIYLYTYGMAFALDVKTFKRTWFQGLMYPGLLSVYAIVQSVLPNAWGYPENLHENVIIEWSDIPLLLMEVWIGFSLLAAWLLMRFENKGGKKRWVKFWLLIIGYGSLLGSINLNAIIIELRGYEMKWDKTERFGKLLMTEDATVMNYDYTNELLRDKKRELWLFLFHFSIVILLLRLFLYVIPHYLVIL